MKIPKKINPDNLKDTIVQVLFTSAISPELFIGSFSHIFSGIFKFITATPKSKGLKLDGDNLLISPIEKGFFLDKTETVKVDVTGGAIVFNCYKDYIGWDKYTAIINATIEKLFSSGLIKDVTRVGIRYISVFDDVNLINSLNMNLSIEIPNKGLNSTQVRTEYIENEFKVILTLINKINQQQESEKEASTASIIDIDVIQILKNNSDIKSVLQIIENGHQKQKSTFFSLLKPSFLETLKPEY
jgi:uncharacterized protein (TIGR04255 family)